MAQEYATKLHPHASCPHCVEPTVDELVAFFVDNVGKRSWQDNMRKFLKSYNVIRR